MTEDITREILKLGRRIDRMRHNLQRIADGVDLLVEQAGRDHKPRKEAEDGKE